MMNSWTFYLLQLNLMFGYGTAYHLYFEEIAKFCTNNGLKYVALFDNQISIPSKKYFLKLNSMKNFRSIIIDDLSPFIFTSTKNIDTLLLFLNDVNHYDMILEVLHLNTRLKSIIVINKSDFTTFKMKAKYFSKNSYFYLLLVSPGPSFVWYDFMILNNVTKTISNKLKFNPSGQIIEDYDLNGAKIMATSSTYLPYYSGKNCDDNNLNCDNGGIGTDLMDLWAREFNFTWDLKYTNSWGMFPISGT